MHGAALASLLALTAPPPAVVAPSAPSAPPAAELEAQARLAQRLAAQVSLDEKATDAEKALYAEAVGLMLRTPTGRSLTERLLATGERAVVSFEDYDDRGGQADEALPVGHVGISRGLLAWSPEWAGVQTAETLAHELLGHTLFGRLASDAGVGWEYNAALHDELNAEVVGWLVCLEAGWRFPDPWAQRLLKDRGEYEKRLQGREPSYATGLRAAELADPLSVLRGRLAEADAQARTKYHDALTERVSLLAGREDLRDRLARYPKSPFYASFEAELAGRIERLRAILPPDPESQSPVVAFAGLPPL